MSCAHCGYDPCECAPWYNGRGMVIGGVDGVVITDDTPLTSVNPWSGRTMLQAVTFDLEEDNRLRVARLHSVDESEDDW